MGRQPAPGVERAAHDLERVRRGRVVAVDPLQWLRDPGVLYDVKAMFTPDESDERL